MLASATPRPAAASIVLRCPACSEPAGSLADLPPQGRGCAACGFRFEAADGIVRALAPDRSRLYARFLEEYGAIRSAEGRGSEDPEFYLALPYRDLTGRNAGQWAMRARSYRYFERRILPGVETGQPLDILDLGAGNGWMSYRLALHGHRPVAIDISADPRDGLGAARHYLERTPVRFARVLAELERLPFAGGQFDLAIFNSSFHYATSYHRTLRETQRCLKDSGRVVIMDTPIYRRFEHGERMREERHRDFEARYGFRSDSIPSIEFLHDAMLDELADYLFLSWRVYRPWYGLSWHLRPARARLFRRRPPSRFAILVGSFRGP